MIIPIQRLRDLANVVALAALVASTGGARADEWADCVNSDLDRRIASCTKVIETPGVDPDRLGAALIRRALGYAGLGQHQHALRDLDEALRVLPPSDTRLLAIAHNNRGAAWLALDKPSQGLPDSEKAVQLIPQQPHFWAARGSIYQSLGDQQGAMRDHDKAIALGGARWIKHYQCGLRLARFYLGPLDGVLRPELRTALLACVDKGSNCAPWSTDPECPEPVG
jgi:tetratricopeptide (TPR) repeat protein